MSTATEYQWIGKPVPRKEDPKLLTGRAGYVGDVALPGMLHAAVLRSPHAHARIRSIDTAAARALPGVVCVLTGPEALEHVGPMAAFCAEPVPQTAVATEKVRYPGEAVAIVAATDRYVAEDACALIAVDYELLDPLVDPLAAMAPDATRVHDTLDSNVVFHRSLDFGDVDGDLARAAHRGAAARALAPHGRHPAGDRGAVASFDPYSGSMTVWSNCNFINFLPWVFAGPAGVSTNRLRMIPCTVGGSFGSKHLITQVVSIAGALVQGHRTSGALPRGPRPTTSRPTTTSALIGSTTPSSPSPPRGEMLSLMLKIIDDYGAYFQFAHGQHGNAMAQPVRPLPDRQPALRRLVRADQQGPAGLLPRCGRRPRQLHPGTPRRHGRRLEMGLDRVELRRRNFIRPDQFPYKIPTGNIYDSGNYAAVLDRALEIADLDHWAGRAGAAALRGPLPGHRPGQLPGAQRLQRERVVVPLRQPAARRDQHPGEREALGRRHRRRPRRAGLPAVGQQPGDGGQPGGRRGVRHRPAAVSVAYADSTTRRDVRGAGRQPAHDHAVGRDARGVRATIRDKMVRVAATRWR